MTGMVAQPDAEIFDRFLAANEPKSPAAAEFVLAWRVPEADRLRIGVLSDKANKGTLSEAENVELEAYDRLRHSLIRLKSRARAALAPRDVEVPA